MRKLERACFLAAAEEPLLLLEEEEETDGEFATSDCACSLSRFERTGGTAELDGEPGVPGLQEGESPLEKWRNGMGSKQNIIPERFIPSEQLKRIEYNTSITRG